MLGDRPSVIPSQGQIYTFFHLLPSSFGGREQNYRAQMEEIRVNIIMD